MSHRELPTGIVTFWFSDIEQSTRLLQELGHESFAEILQTHDSIIREIVGSSFVSTGGDSFFCVFESVSDAVEAAVAAQIGLEEHPWPDPGRVRVRIGMHTGPARLGGADYVGLDVHRASRIASAGHGGQVLVSDATRSLLGDQLPTGSSLIDLGEHELKDLLQPEHLYQLRIDGLQATFPPIRSRHGGQIRVPEPLTEFVGRLAELGEVGEALTKHRLVTLVGLGGSGKTRLAVEAARSGRLSDSGSVFFVNLADSTDAGSVAKAIAEALSLGEQAGRPVLSTLIDYLGDKSDVLIFDNCEHVVSDVVDVIERLLHECADLRILSTSREPLAIAGERVVEVGPMVLPDDGGPHTAEDSDAVALFVIRARSRSADFDPAPWIDQIHAICRRLDGIPLAIELAAARISMLTPSEILARLDDRFSLLTSNRREARPRHKTLEAALDWSYDLLGPGSQQLLRRLSVFRGGFTMDAVGAICFESSVDALQVLDQLTALHERSLLQRGIVAGGTRFNLLETVREYAYGKLTEVGEQAVLADRHRGYFTEFVMEQTSLLGAGGQLAALEALEGDHDNLREVLHRARATAEIGIAVDLAGRLAWFWYVHGHFTEGEQWAQSLIEHLPDAPDRKWLRLLIASAQFDYRLGFFDRAAGKLEMAVQASVRSGERRLEMWARAYAATNSIYQMKVDTGVREAAKAAALAEEEGDLLAFGYATMMRLMGGVIVLESEGRLTAEEASQVNRELEPLAQMARSLGERNMIGHLLEAQGFLSLRAGDRSGAAAALDESIVALAELGTVGCACHGLEAIAGCTAEMGMLDPALRLIGASDGLRQSVGINVSPMEEPFREQAMRLAAESMPDEAVATLRSSAIGLSMREALQLARDTLARV